MAGRFSVEAIFKGVDKLSAPLRRMQNRVGKFARKAKRSFKSVNRAFTKMNASIKAGAMRAGAGLLVMGLALKSLLTTAAEFGRAIGRAASKFPEGIQRGTAAFKELKKAARDVGATTEFTATEAAQGLNFLAKAGYTAAFSIKALPKLVDFATASELDFARASDIASDALGAFGLASDDPVQKMKNLERVMDVMNLTAASANTSVDELFESMKKSAPLAAAAGVSIETFSSTMALLAGAGIKGSDAGTAAKRVTIALAGVGTKATKVMRNLGIKTADANGDLRDQFDVLDDLRKALGKKTQKQRVTIIEALFGKIPIAAAAKLLDKNTDSLRKLRGELEKSAGSTKKMATFIRDDLKGSLDSLYSAIESVKISIFEAKSGPLKALVDNMTQWVRVNEDLIAQNVAEVIIKIVDGFKFLFKHAETIGKAAGAYAALAISLKAVAVAMHAIDTAMKLKAWVMVAGVPAVVASIGAVTGFGINRFIKAAAAMEQVNTALGDRGKADDTGGSGASAGFDAPTGAAATVPTGGGRTGRPFNDKMTIKWEDMPSNARLESDISNPNVELKTGFSGGVN